MVIRRRKTIHLCLKQLFNKAGEDELPMEKYQEEGTDEGDEHDQLADAESRRVVAGEGKGEIRQGRGGGDPLVDKGQDDLVEHGG